MPVATVQFDGRLPANGGRTGESLIADIAMSRDRPCGGAGTRQRVFDLVREVHLAQKGVPPRIGVQRAQKTIGLRLREPGIALPVRPLRSTQRFTRSWATIRPRISHRLRSSQSRRWRWSRIRRSADRSAEASAAILYFPHPSSIVLRRAALMREPHAGAAARHRAGGTPNSRLNARLNAAVEPKPASLAIRFVALSDDASASAARCSRHCERYCIGA